MRSQDGIYDPKASSSPGTPELPADAGSWRDCEAFLQELNPPLPISPFRRQVSDWIGVAHRAIAATAIMAGLFPLLDLSIPLNRWADAEVDLHEAADFGFLGLEAEFFGSEFVSVFCGSGVGGWVP